MVATYRFEDEVLRGQVTELLEERGREVAALDGTARGIVVRRAGRAAAGAVGIVGGLGFLGAAGVNVALGPRGWFGVGKDTGGELTVTLLGTWAAMGVAYALGSLAGEGLYRRALGKAPQLSGRPREDLARIERARPLCTVVALLDRLSGPSASWPLAAKALLMPLTLHLGLAFLLSGGTALPRWREFDAWIQMSAFSVGLAHLVLAVCLARLGRKLTVENEMVSGKVALGKGFGIVGITALAACLPGVVLLLVPPVVTLLTGIAFVPLAIYLAANKLAAERAALASVDL